MRIKFALWGLLGLACAANPGFAGIFSHFFGHCHEDCNRCSTTIIMRPYNAFSPVCSGNITCDGCCPFPMGTMGNGGGGHGHGHGNGCHAGCPPSSWAPCGAMPHFGSPVVGCTDCGGGGSTSHYLPPASYYPAVSYYPPLPAPIHPQLKGQQGGHPGGHPLGGIFHNGAHTSHYPGYYYPPAYPQPYGGYGGYWPVSYNPYAGYWYGQPGR